MTEPYAVENLRDIADAGRFDGSVTVHLAGIEYVIYEAWTDSGNVHFSIEPKPVEPSVRQRRKRRRPPMADIKEVLENTPIKAHSQLWDTVVDSRGNVLLAIDEEQMDICSKRDSIIHAVNTYEQRDKALREAREALTNMLNVEMDDYCLCQKDMPDYTCCYCEARTALAHLREVLGE